MKLCTFCTNVPASGLRAHNMANRNDMVSDIDNKKVCMFLFNNFTHDSRVLREALSLSEIGYSVTVVARLDDNTLSTENINGIKVKRVSVNPVHLKLVNLIKKPLHWNILLNETNTQDYTTYARKETYRSLNPMTHTAFISVKLFKNGMKKTIGYLKKIGNRGIKNPIVSLLMKSHRTLLILDFNYRAYRLTKGKECDVFHAHDLNTLIGAYLAARKQNANLIYDSHELYLERNRLEPYKPIGKWMRKMVEAYLIKRSDFVITVNDSIARTLADTYKVKLPTVVMNTPSLKKISLPSQSVSLRHVIGIQDSYHILLYSGAITFNRGLENLIESLVYLPQGFLVLMGYSNDKYRNKLKTIAAEKSVAPRLAFFGPVPSDQVTAYAASADLGVAPIENVCLSYYYCSPNKLFEYLLAGLPVIASDFPEMRQIIDEYGVGTTFDPSAPKDIARAVMEIFEAPEKWKDIKEKTHSVASIYNWENESRKLIDIYKSLP